MHKNSYGNARDSGKPKQTLKHKVGGLILLDFKTHYKTRVSKTLRFWHKGRCIDQRDRIEGSEIHPHIYGQFIFNKGAKTL